MPDATTLLLDRTRKGDEEALGQLVSQLYDELRHVARMQRHRLGASDTFNTTAVVHEAYARLAGRDAHAFHDRAQFLQTAARTMRDVLVDYVRTKDARKRGGPLPIRSLHDIAPGSLPGLPPIRVGEILDLDRALKRLEVMDDRQARLVELRYFGGLSIAEAAEALGISPATAKRQWNVARAWLYRELTG